MPRETVDYRECIFRDPDSMVGKPVVKGTHVAVEQVIASLAAEPDLEALLREYPALTRDDVRAVLAYAHDRIVADIASAQSTQTVSPQDFFAEISKRPDVSELLRRLSR